MKNKLVTGTEVKKGNLFLSDYKIDNLRISWIKFSQNKFSILGLIMVLISILIAVFAGVITPYPQHVKEFVDFANMNMPPSTSYFFGTDIFGRDVLSRLIFSFRGALIMPIGVLGISVPVGVTLGLLAGYHRGSKLEIIIMRLTDVFLSMPRLVLALAVAAVLKPSLTNAMFALTVTWWTWYTRMIYGATRSISRENFIRSAEIIGASEAHKLFREILPNCLSPIFTKVALDVGLVIIIGSTLSFVGLAEQPPHPGLGQMIADGSRYVPELWWMTIFPALATAFIIMGFNFFGDGIRDMLERGK